MKHLILLFVLQITCLNLFAQFGAPQEIISFPEESIIENLQQADIDNDGDDDFLFRLLPANNLYLLKNNFPFTNIDTTVLVENAAEYFQFAETNNDGAIDIVFIDNVFATENDSVSVLFNDGSGGFNTTQANVVQYEEGSKFGDIDGDGDDDYLTIDVYPVDDNNPNSFNSELSILSWENDAGLFSLVGDTTFSYIHDYRIIAPPTLIERIVDFDEDGLEDVIINFKTYPFGVGHDYYHFMFLKIDESGQLTDEYSTVYEQFEGQGVIIYNGAYDFGIGFPDGSIDYVQSYYWSTDQFGSAFSTGEHLPLQEIDSTINYQSPGFNNGTWLDDVFSIVRFIEFENNGLGDFIEYLNDEIYFHQQTNPYRYDTKQLIGIVSGLNVIEQAKINEDEYGDLLLITDNSISWMQNLFSTYQTFEILSFWDENENGQYEEIEMVLEAAIQVDGNEVLHSSNNEYGLYLTDTSNISLYNMESWNITGTQTNYQIYLDSIFNDTIFYFPVVPLGEFVMQDVDITASITRCNQTTNYWITYTNEGTVITNGYVQLIPDTLTSFIEAFPPPDSTSGDTLYWFYNDLQPTYSSQITAQFDMPGPEAIDTMIVFEANIATWEGTGNDKDIYSSELVCAYDPNDKLVSPGLGEENYALFEDTLEYTIRFQNTGTDTAFQVKITDRLDENLNLSTFQVIASSHPMEASLDINDGFVEFLFNDIYLPDSFVNEPASHGFVKFAIRAQEGIEELTEIENTANIIFDVNPSIKTNTVSSTLSSVFPSVFNGRIFLEGAINNLGTGMENSLLGQNRPLTQPYDQSPYNYTGSESVNSHSYYTVDWVLVEARIGNPNLGGFAGTEVVETRAALLRSNGKIIDSGNLSGLRFLNLVEGEPYYFSIRHRNHLDIITAVPINAGFDMQYDFTTDVSQAFGEAQQKIHPSGQSMLWAGDINGDGLIQTTDYDLWFLNNATSSTYHPADLNLDKTIQTTDYDLWFLNNAKVGNVEIQY